MSKIVIACDCKTVVDDITKGRGDSYEAIVKEFLVRSSSLFNCLVPFEGHHVWLISPHDPTCIPLNIIGDQ